MNGGPKHFLLLADLRNGLLERLQQLYDDRPCMVFLKDGLFGAPNGPYVFHMAYVANIDALAEPDRARIVNGVSCSCGASSAG